MYTLTHTHTTHISTHTHTHTHIHSSYRHIAEHVGNFNFDGYSSR